MVRKGTRVCLATLLDMRLRVKMLPNNYFYGQIPAVLSFILFSGVLGNDFLLIQLRGINY